MKFTKYADGRYRCINTDPDTGKQALFTTKQHPTEVGAWEESGVTTETGLPVMVPKTETVEVEVDEIKIHKAQQVEDNAVKMDW